MLNHQQSTPDIKQTMLHIKHASLNIQQSVLNIQQVLLHIRQRMLNHRQELLNLQQAMLDIKQKLLDIKQELLDIKTIRAVKQEWLPEYANLSLIVNILIFNAIKTSDCFIPRKDVQKSVIARNEAIRN